MRNSSAANSAASSPPVPARISRIALRSSSSSFGSSASLTAEFELGQALAQRAAPPPRPAPSARGRRRSRPSRRAAASSASAPRRFSMPSTIGPSSLYSFDSLANSAPPIPAPDSAARSSACRRSSWSKRVRVPGPCAQLMPSAVSRAARSSSATSLCAPLSRSRTVATPLRRSRPRRATRRRGRRAGRPAACGAARLPE